MKRFIVFLVSWKIATCSRIFYGEVENVHRDVYGNVLYDCKQGPVKNPPPKSKKYSVVLVTVGETCGCQSEEKENRKTFKYTDDVTSFINNAPRNVTELKVQEY